jgi:hypothetical protein
MVIKITKNWHPVGKAAFMVLFPILISMAAIYLMEYISGRAPFPKTGDPDAIPLNLRWRGYSEQAATDYWTWLRNNDELIAERRFLVTDLFFPFFYAGTMLTSVMLAWNWLNHSFDPKWVVICIAILVLADWTENLVHLHQLGYFVRNESLHAAWVQVASSATIIKSGFLVLSAIQIGGLAVPVARQTYVTQGG